MYCARTHDPTDDFRSKIIGKDVLAHLIGLLQDSARAVRSSSLDVITTLAKFGRSMSHLCHSKSHRPADDFRSKILEKDILVHLFRLLQDIVLRIKSRKAITTLAEFSGFLYHFLYWASTDNSADDFRSKMVETGVYSCLISWLQDGDENVRSSSMEIMTTLAKFCRSIRHFVLCED